MKHTYTSSMSQSPDGRIIEIGANQADGVDPVPPRTVANLNVKLQHKSDKVKEQSREYW